MSVDELTRLKAEYADLVQEAKDLRDRKNKLDDELKEVEDRQRALAGGYHRSGLVRQKKAEIERFERIQEQKKKPRVIWTDGTTSEDKIVEKVTPKRIFVMDIGGTRATQYVRKTGEQVSAWSGAKKIDLDAMEISRE